MSINEREKQHLDQAILKLLSFAGLNHFPNNFSILGVPTTEALTWHVETTGNDATGDGSVDRPFATPAGAVAHLRSYSAIEHQVDVILGVGNFPGFLFSGVNIRQQTLMAPVGVRILGTYVAPVLTSGPTSGTIASRVSGSTVGTVAFTSITVTGQVAWVVDELRGMLLELVTGTGAPTMLPILSNTADTIVFATTSTTFGSVGGTFNIRVWGSTINTTVALPPSLSFFGAAAFTPGNTVIGIYNPTAGNVIQITLEGLRIGPTTAPANATGIIVNATPVQIRRCFVGGTGTSAQGGRISLNGYSGASSTVTGCIIASPGQSNVTMFTATNIPGLSYSACLSGLSTLATGYLPMRIAGQGVALGSHGSFTNVPVLTVSSIMMHPLSFGMTVSNCQQAIFSVLHADWFGNNLSAPVTFSGATNGTLSAVLIQNAAVTSAVNITAPARVTATGLFGAGNLQGVRLQPGGKLKIDATTTITGTQTDILMSDSINLALAVLRSLSPKVVQDNFETHIFEP